VKNEQCKRRLIERIKYHGGRDTMSHVVKRSNDKGHPDITKDLFEIIGKA